MIPREREEDMEGDHDGNGKVVCVTGGTGFVASWLIMRLLQNGYSVNTTVRSLPAGANKDLSFLTTLPGASDRLKVFTADLNQPESFQSAIDGCTGVFHVATPLDFYDKESTEMVTERAVNGALGILKACLKSKTVKRVVYTSSSAAVMFAGEDVEEVDESYWSDLDLIRVTKMFGGSYESSKTLTEMAVLKFAEENELDLVTVIPTSIIGPFIIPKLPGSVAVTLAMVFGNEKYYGGFTDKLLVHIDDVARAHIFLLEYPDAKGRYFCSSQALSLQQMSDFFSTKYPEFSIPTRECLAEIKGMKTPKISSKKLLDTGFKYKYGLDEIFDQTIQCCNFDN